MFRWAVISVCLGFGVLYGAPEVDSSAPDKKAAEVVSAEKSTSGATDGSPAVVKAAVPTAEKAALKSAMALPPPGTVLKQVRMPRYENQQLAAYMTAQYVKMLEHNRMFGKTVFIRLYNQDGSRAEAMLDDAVFDTVSSMLQSSKPVTLRDSRFTASGTKITLDTAKKVGFLSGPVHTTFQLNSSTESLSPSKQ